VLPDDGPRITGGRPRYQVHDLVSVNCTSGRSKPAVQLNWFINGEPANHSFLRNYTASTVDPDGLETTTLGLEFRVKPKHFKRGDMKLKVRIFTFDGAIHFRSCTHHKLFLATVFGHNFNGLLEEQRRKRGRR
jgi:hypothetical protein